MNQARADATDAAFETPPEQLRAPVKFSAEFSAPIIQEHFLPLPYGFIGRNISSLGIRASLLLKPPVENERSAGFKLNGLMAFTQASLTPIVGLGFEVVSIKPTDRFVIDIGAEVQDQKLVTPFAGSQFSVLGYIVLLRLGYDLNPVKLRMEFKSLSVSDTSLTQFEGIETSVAHKKSYVTSPGIRLYLPFNLMSDLSMDLYSLGETAIASKEFGYAMPERTVYKTKLGLGIGIKNMEVWTRAMFVRGVVDHEELYYQSPLVWGDNLFASYSQMLELVWRP